MKKNLTVKAAVVLVAILTATGAMAAGEASAAMDAIKTEAGTLIADAWPIVTSVVIAIIGMKLFKKFASKST